MAIPLLDSENLIKQISTSTATATTTRTTANRTLKHNQQKFHVNFMSKRVVDKVIIQQHSHYHVPNWHGYPAFAFIILCCHSH